MLFAYPTGVQADTNSRVAIERGRSRRAILASKNFEFARQSSESNQCNGAARGGLVSFMLGCPIDEGLIVLQTEQHSIAIAVQRRTRITYRCANPGWEYAALKNDPQHMLLRRDLLKLTIAGVGAVGMLPSPASAKPVDLDQKRKARYRADSQEVRNFYRVNAYPAAR